MDRRRRMLFVLPASPFERSSSFGAMSESPPSNRPSMLNLGRWMPLAWKEFTSRSKFGDRVVLCGLTSDSEFRTRVEGPTSFRVRTRDFHFPQLDLRTPNFEQGSWDPPHSEFAVRGLGFTQPARPLSDFRMDRGPHHIRSSPFAILIWAFPC